VFGLIHGIYLTTAALTKKQRDEFFASATPTMRSLRAAGGVVITYLLMSFSQIWFQARSIEAASARVMQLAGSLPSGVLTLAGIRSDVVVPLYFCIPIAFYVGAGAPGFADLWRPVERRVPGWAIYGAALLLLSALTTGAGSKFIYGQF
jgi:alginate O-acetyltransferase complex protein AlgI